MLVPAHHNIAINEAAYREAKAAFVHGSPETCQFSSFDIFYPSERKAVSIWQEVWDNGSKGRFCYSILPTVTTNPWWSSYNLNRRQIVVLSKLISNHSRIAAHLKRNNIIEDDNCECGDGASSPDHLIFTCARYEDHRQELWRAVIKEGVVIILKTKLKTVSCTNC